METKRRSLVKAVSWRFFATIITGTIVWIMTGEAKFAVAVGFFDTAVKIFAYYAHERIWVKLPYGKKKDIEYQI